MFRIGRDHFDKYESLRHEVIRRAWTEARAIERKTRTKPLRTPTRSMFDCPRWVNTIRVLPSSDTASASDGEKRKEKKAKRLLSIPLYLEVNIHAFSFSKNSSSKVIS